LPSSIGDNFAFEPAERQRSSQRLHRSFARCRRLVVAQSMQALWSRAHCAATSSA